MSVILTIHPHLFPLGFHSSSTFTGIFIPSPDGDPNDDRFTSTSTSHTYRETSFQGIIIRLIIQLLHYTPKKGYKKLFATQTTKNSQIDNFSVYISSRPLLRSTSISGTTLVRQMSLWPT